VANSSGATPLTIPNREVKTACADGTARKRRESRRLPWLCRLEVMLAVLPFIKINARIPQWQVNGLICHLGGCYDLNAP